jgi:hypothetical protein
MMRHESPSDRAWAHIETERRRDRFVRRVCVAAWTATFVVALVFAAFVAVPVFQMVRLVQVGAMTWAGVVGAAMPFLGVLWTLCLLIAALSTVGVFLRQRTASLAEIQLRLAALEDMLGARGDASGRE